jgi:hypothetical protein
MHGYLFERKEATASGVAPSESKHGRATPQARERRLKSKLQSVNQPQLASVAYPSTAHRKRSDLQH